SVSLPEWITVIAFGMVAGLPPENTCRIESISSAPTRENDTAGQPALRNAMWSVGGYLSPADNAMPCAFAAASAAATSGWAGSGVIIHTVSPQPNTSKLT